MDPLGKKIRLDTPSLLLTVAIVMVLATSFAMSFDAPTWWILTAFLLLAIIPTLILLPKLWKTKNVSEPLWEQTISIASGVRAGFLAGGFATLPLILLGLFLSGFRASIAMILVPFELLAFLLAWLSGAIVSVLDFRRWADGKKLEDLKPEELFSVTTEERYPRQNFKDGFWTLVPFFAGGRRDIGSRPILPRKIMLVLLGFAGVAVLTGFELWVSILFSATVSLFIFTATCFYSYRKALVPYDGHKLVEMAREVALARGRWAVEHRKRYTQSVSNRSTTV